jgi:hypothetical protein
MQLFIICSLVYVVLAVILVLMFRSEYKKGRVSAGMVLFQYTSFHVVAMIGMFAVYQSIISA